MASSLSICRSCLARSAPSTLLRFAPSTSTPRLRLLPATYAPLTLSPCFSTTPKPLAGGGAINRAKARTSKQVKKKKVKTHFKIWNHADSPKFALMDAIRYIRAFEVGNDQRQMKYDLAIKIHTLKNGPTVKSRIQLPKAVKTDVRICVFAEGKQAEAARQAGAVAVGSTELLEEIKNGADLNYDRIICHTNFFPTLQKANLGRVLGPKGLMPSPKTGTVVGDVSTAIQAMIGASEYRERQGVVRIAIAQLSFTPEEVRDNVKAFVEQFGKDLARIEDFDKRINEVVLSSTNSPAFSLSGEFRSDVGKIPEVSEAAAAEAEAAIINSPIQVDEAAGAEKMVAL
ncbi:hypothetical protein H072_8615 [Dactylellina haptotyla CBS 200.50]|uniref:Ribosomal protein n=1 Tax=Dactylellina haptotyla (strain CBS 200.50) TaxID=1284197 RepID=S8A4P6_DACHA|nr:hypothetical protein H072_8615 [Dactylellina haptotyla CBS 200.50]